MNTFIRAVAALLVLGSCSLWAQDKHIDVMVESDGGGYKLRFLNSECPGRPNEPGCVLAEAGNSPNITWRMSDSNRDWVFTRLQFSADGQHWGDPSRPLDDCTVEDFDLTDADRYSGSASSAQVLANGAMLKIKDHNRNRCVTHYRIYAMPAGGGMEIDSDPIIDNRGEN